MAPGINCRVSDRLCNRLRQPWTAAPPPGPPPAPPRGPSPPAGPAPPLVKHPPATPPRDGPMLGGQQKPPPAAVELDRLPVGPNGVVLEPAPPKAASKSSARPTIKK